MRVYEYPALGPDEAVLHRDEFNIKLGTLDMQYCFGCGHRFWDCYRGRSSCQYWHDTALLDVWLYITRRSRWAKERMV
jgi:hypothetical protein